MKRLILYSYLPFSNVQNSIVYKRSSHNPSLLKEEIVKSEATKIGSS